MLIVAYKCHDLVEKCLDSVAEHLPELPVYVYENSGEGYPGREELAARYPGAHWVLGPVNLGFAAAVNALVEHTPPDADLLVLNPDAGFRGPLTRTRELLRQPGVAAVAPRCRDDGAPVRRRGTSRRAAQRLIRVLVAAAGYSDSLARHPVSQLYARQPNESQSIDGYVGRCCLAISRAAWNALGGFDEEFFLYGEEADWQARARAAGWRIVLADELGADHGNLRPPRIERTRVGARGRVFGRRTPAQSTTCCAPIPRLCSSINTLFTMRIYTSPAQRFWTECSGRGAPHAGRRARNGGPTCRRS